MRTIKTLSKKLFVCSCFIIICNCIFAQSNLTVENVSQLNMQLFCLTTPTDTIHFLKYDTINEKKPLLLFIQGSLPKPLIVEDNGNLDANPFKIFSKSAFKQFNVVEISQPNTPPIVNVKNLNHQYSYIKSDNPYDFDKTYLQRNVTETYVERANEVINCLVQQNWIDIDSIFVYGHSQGAHIAAHLAAENSRVKAIAFSSTNPFGRYQGIMQTIRSMAISGKITEEEAQKQIEAYWKWWDIYCYGIPLPENYIGDLPATCLSFSQSVVDILANLKQPVFVVYGTRDYHSVACELLPIYFGFSKKNNYKMHPMLGRGHNFELIEDNGNTIWSDTKWTEVMDEFLKFVKKEN
jgi:pimeloyl-ACP methyl ester carboxylesterase